MNNKLILEHCPNFYNINNFSFFEDDTISARLIDIYRKFVFEVDLNNFSNTINEVINFIKKLKHKSKKIL